MAKPIKPASGPLRGDFLIYCRLPGKPARPLGGLGLVINRIHAEIFTVRTASDEVRFGRELQYLRDENPGDWFPVAI